MTSSQYGAGTTVCGASCIPRCAARSGKRVCIVRHISSRGRAPARLRGRGQRLSILWCEQ